MNKNFNKKIIDNEERSYFYGFDYDVMHPFMIKSFKPHIIDGSMLELGSYTGQFTKRLLELSNDITCVEGADSAIEQVDKDVAEQVQIVNASFEEVVLDRKFDNIILTHVLEHIEYPVDVLTKIRTNWLAEGGRLFVVCPNANAPSRQIAVKMGLISHNSAVTDGEAAHGHYCTYSLDTLERDVTAAGWKVIHRSGIFFKALANFQWDRLLQTDIISKEYLEGCYALGQQYPDLCSSIFLLCEQGDA